MYSVICVVIGVSVPGAPEGGASVPGAPEGASGVGIGTVVIVAVVSQGMVTVAG